MSSQKTDEAKTEIAVEENLEVSEDTEIIENTEEVVEEDMTIEEAIVGLLKGCLWKVI